MAFDTQTKDYYKKEIANDDKEDNDDEVDE